MIRRLTPLCQAGNDACAQLKIEQNLFGPSALPHHARVLWIGSGGTGIRFTRFRCVPQLRLAHRIETEAGLGVGNQRRPTLAFAIGLQPNSHKPSAGHVTGGPSFGIHGADEEHETARDGGAAPLDRYEGQMGKATAVGADSVSWLHRLKESDRKRYNEDTGALDDEASLILVLIVVRGDPDSESDGTRRIGIFPANGDDIPDNEPVWGHDAAHRYGDRVIGERMRFRRQPDTLVGTRFPEFEQKLARGGVRTAERLLLSYRKRDHIGARDDHDPRVRWLPAILGVLPTVHPDDRRVDEA